MRKSRFTESQILEILKAGEAGVPVADLARKHGISRSGEAKPERLIERFNKTYRTEVLDAYVFESVDQVQRITESWLIDYNEQRPHDSLGRVPPLPYRPRAIDGQESSFELCP